MPVSHPSYAASAVSKERLPPQPIASHRLTAGRSSRPQLLRDGAGGEDRRGRLTSDWWLQTAARHRTPGQGQPAPIGQTFEAAASPVPAPPPPIQGSPTSYARAWNGRWPMRGRRTAAGAAQGPRRPGDLRIGPPRLSLSRPSALPRDSLAHLRSLMGVTAPGWPYFRVPAWSACPGGNQSRVQSAISQASAAAAWPDCAAPRHGETGIARARIIAVSSRHQRHHQLRGEQRQYRGCGVRRDVCQPSFGFFSPPRA